MRSKASAAFIDGAGGIDDRLATGLAKIALGARSKLAVDAARHELSAVQAQALTILAGEPLGMGDLARRLGLTAPTVSESVRVLQEKGYVARTKEGRAVTVRVTRRGRALGKKLTLWTEFLADVARDMPEPEKIVLLRAVLFAIRGLIERGIVQEARMCVTCEHFRPRVHDDPKAPHHCALADVPFADSLVRLDCSDYQPADEHLVPLRWKTFLLPLTKEPS